MPPFHLVMELASVAWGKKAKPPPASPADPLPAILSILFGCCCVLGIAYRSARPTDLPSVAFASIAVAVLSIAAVAFDGPLRWALCYEVMAATVASLLVTPMTLVVDVAVSKSASGQTTVSKALLQGAGEWLRTPLTLLRQPAFALCWFVYLATYSSANVVQSLCTSYLLISPVLPKLVVVTLTNMAACGYKDARLAQIFGKADEKARPFPPLGYLLFFLRDLLANGAGFTLPPLVAPLLDGLVVPERRQIVAQLLVPAAVNTITSPMHFTALSLYNNPTHTASQHAALVGATYVGATTSRILKGLAAYGIGGISNTALRARLL